MMPMPTVSIVDSPRPNTDRVKKHKDGSILLSISEDRVCKLNGVGAVTWMILEDSEARLTLDEIVHALQQQFAAINAEGELRYEVSREQLRTDTTHFLEKVVAMSLVEVSAKPGGPQFYSIKDDVSATTSATITTGTENFATETIDENIKPSKRETFSAFIGLLAFDLMLKFAGFKSLIKKVEGWSTAEPRTTNRELCRRVRGMVDRAQMYYPKKAMCLQHAAVVTCLLRQRGIPAEMVLAAQELPPKAHAWAEVMNEVVSDSPTVKMKYRELRRL